MPSALSSLRGQPRGQHQWALVALAGGRASLTGCSPALGAIMCPPSCQPSFHLLKCKSSPVVLLPTALPRSHGSQLWGRRLNSSANAPAAPLHPAASASASGAPCQFCLQGGGCGLMVPSAGRCPPHLPSHSPLLPLPGVCCVLGGGNSMLLTPWPLPAPRMPPGLSCQGHHRPAEECSARVLPTWGLAPGRVGIGRGRGVLQPPRAQPG